MQQHLINIKRCYRSKIILDFIVTLKRKGKTNKFINDLMPNFVMIMVLFGQDRDPFKFVKEDVFSFKKFIAFVHELRELPLTHRTGRQWYEALLVYIKYCTKGDNRQDKTIGYIYEFLEKGWNKRFVHRKIRELADLEERSETTTRTPGPALSSECSRSLAQARREFIKNHLDISVDGPNPSRYEVSVLAGLNRDKYPELLNDKWRNFSAVCLCIQQELRALDLIEHVEKGDVTVDDTVEELIQTKLKHWGWFSKEQWKKCLRLYKTRRQLKNR